MDLKPVEINQLHKDWTISFLFFVFPCTYKSAILSKIAVETTLDSQTGCLLQTFRRSRPCMFLEWLLNATEDLGINLTVNTSMSIDRGLSLRWRCIHVVMRSIHWILKFYWLSLSYVKNSLYNFLDHWFFWISCILFIIWILSLNKEMIFAFF